MLDYVLPNKDCPGIYKITNDRNKKSYIGRSTSVRKRLTDHVKSAVGISTIASQKIHDIMREEGLWNFTFELIEECDKDKLSEREKYYIDFFQTADTIYGYNQKAGG
jgi:group I intron endonuclease